MNVACRFDQHSLRFGQRASSQTVATPLSATTDRVCEKSPDGSGRFNHAGRRRFGASSDDDNTASCNRLLLRDSPAVPNPRPGDTARHPGAILATVCNDVSRPAGASAIDPLRRRGFNPGNR